MDLAFYHHPARVYASSSVECLLQRPGGPRFATQELDPFGEPYVVGLQIGFRRRSLGIRPSFDGERDSDEADLEPSAPVARRWSAAALEFGKKAKNNLRRGSQSHPPNRLDSDSPPHPRERVGSGQRRSSEVLQHLPTQPEGVAEVDDVGVDIEAERAREQIRQGIVFTTDSPAPPAQGENRAKDERAGSTEREPVLVRAHKRLWGSHEPKFMRETHNWMVKPLG